MPKKQNKSTSTFAEAVYAIVATIPSGSTMTYKEVAIAIGRHHAARAVALVLAKNYDERIPCHRVIRSDGLVGGYNRGGSKIKQKILIKEARSSQAHKQVR